MAIEDDIALFSRVPTLNLLGAAALQVLAIGAEQRDYGFGERLFLGADDLQNCSLRPTPLLQASKIYFSLLDICM